MKVILVNGSPREKGCTYTALCEVAGALEKNGIETEIFQVGAKPIAGCIGCNVCLKNGRCFVDDPVNEFVEKAKTADGFRLAGALCGGIRCHHLVSRPRILRKGKCVCRKAGGSSGELQTRRRGIRV